MDQIKMPPPPQNTKKIPKNDKTFTEAKYGAIFVFHGVLSKLVYGKYIHF
jgi:hypothetical protein